MQRTDSALRLNVHVHVLALDGVDVREGEHGPLVFRPLTAPTRADVADVAQATACRIEKLLQEQGRSLDPTSADSAAPELEPDEAGLAACYAAVHRLLREHGPLGREPPTSPLPHRPRGPPGQLAFRFSR